MIQGEPYRHEYHHMLDLVCCLDATNFAATYVAKALHKIALGDAHVGCFGGEEIEAAAQAIKALRKSHRELLAACKGELRDRPWRSDLSDLIKLAEEV